MQLLINERKITIDVNALSQNLYNMHVKNDCLAPLAFGMLDANIMNSFKQDLTEGLKDHSNIKQYEPIKGNDFPNFNKVLEDLRVQTLQEISKAVNEITKAVSIGIYQRAKMVV